MDDGQKSWWGRSRNVRRLPYLENTIFSAKRYRPRIDSPEAKIARAIYPYQLAEGPHGDIRVRIYGKRIFVPEISSIFRRSLRICHARLARR